MAPLLSACSHLPQLSSWLDAGELAAGAVGLMGIGTASGVAAGIAMGGTLVGLEVAAAGTGLSLGSLTLPAGLAGAGIAGTSYAAAGLAFTILSAQALANATVTNVVVREACEFAEALAEFDPEDINDRDEPVQEDSGANDSSIPSGDTGGACDQTYEPIDVSRSRQLTVHVAPSISTSIGS